jgi:hypothetical protein
MSDRRSQPNDWSEQSEALFQSARGDHAPTAFDRARVRSALAQRLAAASNVAPAGGTLPTPGAHPRTSRAALGKLVKIGVGVACVMAGTFAVMRDHQSSKPAARTPAALPPTAANAKPSAPAPAPAASTQASATTAHDQPVIAVVVHSESAATARVGTKRSRARSTPQKLSTPARATAQAAPPSSSAEQVGPHEPQALVSDTSAAVSTSAVAQDPVAEPEPGQRATAQPKPARLPAAEQADSADERAELAFVARINAALRESKLRSVLALCTEHERRWPHGAFVQEREALRAIASCGTGVTGADARARTFLASYPRAPLAPRVHDACVQQLKATGDKRSAAAPGKAGDK